MKRFVFLAVILLSTSSAIAKEKIDEDYSLRYQPGFQLNVFATSGGLDGEAALGFGGQVTLLKWGPLSFGGAGMSLVRLEQGHRMVPYAELVTINFRDTRGERNPNIIGLTFKYVVRNAFYQDGMPLDHGLAIGFVFAGF